MINSSLNLQVPSGRGYTHIAFGPKGLIAASFDRSLHFIDSLSGRMLEAIEDAHDAAITQLTWRPELAIIGTAIAAFKFTFCPASDVRVSSSNDTIHVEQARLLRDMCYWESI